MEEMTVSENFFSAFLSTINHNRASVFLTVVAMIFSVLLWAQNTRLDSFVDSIEQNRINISENQKLLEKLAKEIEISNGRLAKETQRYIDKNYGALSKRDEDVDKLVYLYRQEDKRISNIEMALAKQ